MLIGGIKIVGWDGPEEDRKVTRIEAWYDPHYKDWVIELQDNNGYEVEDCIRVVGRKAKDKMVKELKEQYGIE